MILLFLKKKFFLLFAKAGIFMNKNSGVVSGFFFGNSKIDKKN